MPPNRRSRGCNECHNRKIKCDERSPICARCHKIGLACSGPVTGPIIVSFNTPHVSQRMIPESRADWVLCRSPFPSYPVPYQLSDRERYLVHHFVTEISSNIFHLTKENPKFHPLRDIVLPSMFQGRFGVAGIMVYTINHLASVYYGHPTYQAIESESRCITLLSQKISQQNTSSDDGAIFLVLSLIATETEIWSKSQDSSKQERLNAHVQGLRQMIVQRGGFGILNKCARISWLLHWFNLVLSGALSVGLMPLPRYRWSREVESENSDPTPAQSTEIKREDIQFCFAELVNFYSRIYHWVKANRGGFCKCSHSCTMLRNLLHSSTPLLQHLSGPAETQGILDKCAVLHYLSATAWDLRNRSLVDVESYYSRLRKLIIDQGLVNSGSLAVLLWVLKTDYDAMNVQCPERLFFTARSLYVLNKAGPSFRRRFEAAMLGFWSPSVTSTVLDVFSIDDPAFAWTPAAFRDDLIAELVVNSAR